MDLAHLPKPFKPTWKSVDPMHFVGPYALSIHPTTNLWRMRGHKSFIVFDRRPSPLVLKRIVKSLTIPPSQCSSNDSNLWPGFDTTCRTVCLTDPSNDQLVKDEGVQIFYSIRSETKPIGIGANCEIPHTFDCRWWVYAFRKRCWQLVASFGMKSNSNWTNRSVH